MAITYRGNGNTWFVIDTPSGLMFDGETWTDDKRKAKVYPNAGVASIVAEEQEFEQKAVVAELSEKFGG